MRKQQHYTLTKVRKVKSYLITPLIYFLIGKSCYFLLVLIYLITQIKMHYLKAHLCLNVATPMMSQQSFKHDVIWTFIDRFLKSKTDVGDRPEQGFLSVWWESSTLNTLNLVLQGQVLLRLRRSVSNVEKCCPIRR